MGVPTHDKAMWESSGGQGEPELEGKPYVNVAGQKQNCTPRCDILKKTYDQNGALALDWK